jgi:ferredoxin
VIRSQPRSGIRIDRQRCIGSGVCVVHAPGSFDVGDDAKVTLLDGSDPIEAIRAAIEGCPTRALSLVEPGEEGSGAAR